MRDVRGVRVAGLAAAVPRRSIPWSDHIAAFGDEAGKIAQTTGVAARRTAGPALTASDLCLPAARRVLEQLAWQADSVDLLVFVSQTPDELLPATAASLHARLGLARHCAAFDVTLGCSGFLYGLWLASSLISAGQARRALVLVGDTISRTVDPTDRATAMLFGDAGTATALEFDPQGAAAPMSFALGSDGAGREHLIVAGGGFRDPAAKLELHMNGAEVFAFTLREVPPMVKSALAQAGWSLDDIDHVVFHQANRFLLQHLAKKLKIPESRLVIALEQHGNTSGASIPLAMALRLAPELRERPLKLLLAGFGVGWSWGAVALSLGPMVVSDVLEIEEAVEPAP